MRSMIMPSSNTTSTAPSPTASKRKLEVKVTVLLSGSKSEEIRIHKGEDVEQVAEAFIAEHGLEQHREKLMNHIKTQVSKAKKKRAKKVRFSVLSAASVERTAVEVVAPPPSSPTPFLMHQLSSLFALIKIPDRLLRSSEEEMKEQDKRQQQQQQQLRGVESQSRSESVEKGQRARNRPPSPLQPPSRLAPGLVLSQARRRRRQ